MSAPEPSKLESLLVAELLALLDGADVGQSLEIPSAADLCYSMELYLPQLLRKVHGEWERESLDGFFIAEATKTGNQEAAIVGTCILISDQRLSPFRFDVEVAASCDHVASYRVRVGEPGVGPLGISGPPCRSRGATSLLYGLVERLEWVCWTYDVVGPPPQRGAGTPESHA